MNDIMSKESKKTTIMDVFKYDIIVGIKQNEISVLKNRYDRPEKGLNFDQVEEIALDLISRSLQIHERRIFSEVFKKDMKQKLREVIREHSA
jgi:hypothetical protein